MTLDMLNPFVRSVALYEKLNRTDECVAYDARLLYMISGDVSVTLSGEKLGHLSPGHALYIPSGVPYKLKGQYLRCVVITFDLTDKYSSENQRIAPSAKADFIPDACHSCLDIPPFDKPIHIEDMESDRDNFISMCDIFTSAQGYYLADLSAQLKSLLVKMAEASDENALPARMVTALDSYIRENCAEDISNTELGAIFGYHPFYISKMLKDRKGITLRQYIINFRLKRARTLLEYTNLTVSDIAEQTGFTDASYFTKTFKNAYGVTPKDFRNGFKDDFV